MRYKRNERMLLLRNNGSLNRSSCKFMRFSQKSTISVWKSAMICTSTRRVTIWHKSVNLSVPWPAITLTVIWWTAQYSTATWHRRSFSLLDCYQCWTFSFVFWGLPPRLWNVLVAKQLFWLRLLWLSVLFVANLMYQRCQFRIYFFAFILIIKTLHRACGWTMKFA